MRPVIDDVNKIQKLTGLISLCPLCHKVKHPGLANIKGESHLVISQLMVVNNITKETAEAYIESAFKIYHERSKNKYKLSIDFLKTYIIDSEKSINIDW